MAGSIGPAAATSDGGAGFCDPRLMALDPLYANVAIRNGVAFTYPGQRVFRRGRYVNERASGEEAGETAEGAAYVESSLQRIRSLRIHGAQCAWGA